MRPAVLEGRRGPFSRDGAGMSAIEIIAAALGLANVLLIVRRSIWNYPFGLAMVALYAWVFFDARLYSDAALQVFFFVVQIYGWWNWTRARGGDGLVREIELLAPSQVTLLSDRRRFAPYGLAGGEDGAKGRAVLRKADGQEIELRGKGSVYADAGDAIRIETPGGGGWGEAENRDREQG